MSLERDKQTEREHDAHPSSIVLIDDESAHRRLFRRALKKAGIDNPLLERASLAQGKALVEELQVGKIPLPCVVVVDLNLGDGRGTALIESLRKHHRTQKIPILVLSTSALESDIEESLLLGASNYLTKGANSDQFCECVVDKLREILDVTLVAKA